MSMSFDFLHSLVGASAPWTGTNYFRPQQPGYPTSSAQNTPRQASDAEGARMELLLGPLIPLNGGNTKERKGKEWK